MAGMIVLDDLGGIPALAIGNHLLLAYGFTATIVGVLFDGETGFE